MLVVSNAGTGDNADHNSTVMMRKVREMIGEEKFDLIVMMLLMVMKMMKARTLSPPYYHHLQHINHNMSTSFTSFHLEHHHS